MDEKERLIKELENYEPYAAHFPHLTVDGKLILDVLRFLRGKPELKFFVDSNGKMTPLPIQEHGHWISVKDNRPKDQKPVIVYVPPHTNRYGDEFIGYVGMAYYTYSVNGGYWCGTDGNVYGAIGAIATPSHWMPLPEPPEEVIQE